MKKILCLLAFLASLGSLTARDIYPLNDGWDFFFKSENSSDNARIVSLPHSWNTDPQAGLNFRETTGNYLREVYIPYEWSNKRLFLRFYGACNVTDLFVNGAHIGEHKGGSTAFTFEITDRIRFGMDNSLQVVVSNSFRSDVLPVSTDTNPYGGLYREVELIVTERDAISPLYYGSEGVLVRPARVDEERVTGEVEVHLLTNPRTNATLHLEMINDKGKTVYTRSTPVVGKQNSIRVPFLFEMPELWSPEEPNLYTVVVRFSNESFRDEILLKTGFRKVSIDPKRGWIAINDKPMRLQGVAYHHDNALGGIQDDAALDEDLDQIQELGATALRSAVHPHRQYLYDRCDEEGMLVWIDMPMQRAPFIGDVDYYSTVAFELNGREQLREIIAQHYNHPSVIMWGIFSQIIPRGDQILEYTKSLNAEVKSLDKNRLTVAVSDQDGPINFITDLIAWRQDVGWDHGSATDLKLWRNQLANNWSHLRSAVTYGAEGFLGMNARASQQSQRHNWLSESRQTRFHEEYVNHLVADSLFWGIWVENMFEYGSSRRPYGLNGNGLVTLDRREKKDAYYLYRTLWNKEKKTVHLVDRRYRMRDRIEQQITVYSSEPNPTLHINDESRRLRKVGLNIYRSDSMQLRGLVQIRVAAGGLGDGVNIQIGNVLRPQSRPGLR